LPARIHLEIGNTQIHFNSRKHLQVYPDNLELIDTAHYAAINQARGMEKVIILPPDHSGAVHMSFTLQEFESFKADIRRYLSEEKRQRFRKATVPDIQAVTPKTEGSFDIYEFKLNE
jgi:hypothetical protein